MYVLSNIKTQEINDSMYKKKHYSLSLIILLLSNLFVCRMVAQEQETEDTHAHASSLKWQGIDVDDVIGNPQYQNNGKKIYLYNVGTGRFIIEGGNWGMEGRLFHETFGRPMYLQSNRLIKSGVQENGNKNVFGCNAPAAFHSQKTWTNWDQYSFTIMMDANSGTRNGWFFIPVEKEDGTHTYYMYETSNVNGYTNNKYYLGAAYGECHAASWKGDGVLVHMGDDRATWTTYDPTEDTNKYDVNGSMIDLNELYQWRLVPEDEFREKLVNEDIGLNPSVSALINDRDFTRNATNFKDYWLTENKSGADYSVIGRLGYAYGTLNKTGKQPEYNNEAWNKPLRLKVYFEKTNNYGWENAKNGYLTFEGVGRTYTEVEVPSPGWYLVQCYGFVQSDSDHDAYIFAKVKGSSETSSTGGESKHNLVKVNAGTYTGKNNMDNCLEVGQDLTDPKRGKKDQWLNTVWICVTAEQFNDPDNPLRTLQIGVGKDEATISNGKINNGTTYYYDTDWVCVDDFRMSYLGLRPAFFYEEEEDFNYIIPAETNTKQYLGASPTGQYGGAICLERTLKTYQWNSFSFPMPLTGEQIRYAFGEDATLAEIHSIGKMSQNANVIDFKSKTLFTTESVVEPGHFYLLKPTKLPTKGYDPQGREAEYYELGRKFFSVKEDEDENYPHFILSKTIVMESSEEIESLDGNHDGTASVNYVRTPGYKSFSVSDGIYTGTTANGIYATKGSYAVSNNTIYHLAKDTPLKGFRGWITLQQPVGQQAKDFSMEVFGIFDKEPVSIATDVELPRIQILSDDEAVYDLFGRKVGNLGSSLPKGLYIVRGKKYLVK